MKLPLPRTDGMGRTEMDVCVRFLVLADTQGHALPPGPCGAHAFRAVSRRPCLHLCQQHGGRHAMEERRSKEKLFCDSQRPQTNPPPTPTSLLPLPPMPARPTVTRSPVPACRHAPREGGGSVVRPGAGGSCRCSVSTDTSLWKHGCAQALTDEGSAWRGSRG